MDGGCPKPQAPEWMPICHGSSLCCGIGALSWRMMLGHAEKIKDGCAENVGAGGNAI